jgi:serine/threonine protein kinase
VILERKKTKNNSNRYQPGEVIFKDYVMLKYIGTGGHGSVNLTKNNKGICYALKVLNEDVRFEKLRFEAIKEISSQHFVKVLDYGETNSKHSCILMEYAKDNLEKILSSKEALDIRIAARYFIELLKGLKVLEENRIIHSNIKPANLFVHDDIIKIGDSAFARFATGLRSSIKRVFGTWEYMAPERFTKNYGFSVDRWASAVLFFRLLTGKMPFEGEDDMQVYGAIMQETPEYSLVPAMFRPFMQHCFKKDSKDRHQSSEEMKSEFINAVKKFTENHTRYSKEEPIPGSPFSGSYSRTFPKYNLRKEPIKVSVDDFEKVFRLNSELEPINYINNEFQDNGDGTITDYATGLMWQKSGSSHSFYYSLAKEYIEILNEERFAEYNDWRLPTIPELMSILKFKKNDKGYYIDPVFNRKQLWCWSADTSSGWVAWCVLFIYGNVYWHFMFNENYVRAVRLINILTI